MHCHCRWIHDDEPYCLSTYNRTVDEGYHTFFMHTTAFCSACLFVVSADKLFATRYSFGRLERIMIISLNALEEALLKVRTFAA